MQDLIICTSSDKKFNEIEYELSSQFRCVRKDVHIIEIQGRAEEILSDKAKKAYNMIGKPILVDDVSFHFEAMGGFPGPYMKDFSSYMKAAEIAKLFQGTKGKAVCRLALILEDENMILAEGEVKGDIVIPKIPEGYGFEPFFIPEGADKTIVEMDVATKNSYSHRGKALEDLMKKIKKHLKHE